MIILGIDPGIARVGWAIVQTARPNPIAKTYGCITTEKTLTPPDRLALVHKGVALLCKKFRPDYMSVEDLFFSTNVKTAIGVGQSRGVILLAAALAKVPVVSYSPTTVKQTICGNGRADKKQIERMIMAILKLREPPKPDDTADAIAIAMTHAYSYKMKGKTL